MGDETDAPPCPARASVEGFTARRPSGGTAVRRDVHMRASEWRVRAARDADGGSGQLRRQRAWRGAYVLRSTRELDWRLRRHELHPRREALRRCPLRAVGDDRAADGQRKQLPADRDAQHLAAALGHVRARVHQRGVPTTLLDGRRLMRAGRTGARVHAVYCHDRGSRLLELPGDLPRKARLLQRLCRQPLLLTV